MAEDEAFADTSQGKSRTTNGRVHHLKSFFHIDKDMLPMKLTYLIWGGLIGTYELYLNPFFVSVGIPKSRAGVLTGIPYVVFTVAAPLWGILTDYSGRHRLISVLLCICSAGWIGSLPLIANLTRVSGSYRNAFPLSLNSSAVNCSGSGCNASSADTSNIEPSSSTTALIANPDTLFYTLFCIMAVGSAFFSCIGGYIEAVALKVIKSSPSGASYGAQRIFGSIGASVVVYLTGVALDNVRIKGYSFFAIIFFAYPAFPIALIPLLLVIITQLEKWTKISTENSKMHADGEMSSNQEKDDEENEKSIWSHLLDMFTNLDVIILMLTSLVAGVAFCLIFFYIFLINEQMDVSKSDISLVFSVASFSNILMFPITSKLMKCLGGPIPSMIFGVLCFGIRHLVMAYTRVYLIMVLIQLLQAFSFALMWSSLMEQIHIVSPSKIRQTMTLIMQSVYFGLGASLCNMVGGVLYEMSNARTLFLWNGVACVVWACVLVLYYGIKYCLGKKNQEPVIIQKNPFNASHDSDILLKTPT